MSERSGQVNGRATLFAVIVAATAIKLAVAWFTFGSDDVRYWTEFASGVKRFGPIGIYGPHHFESVYNHPPLVGWLLMIANWLSGLGIPFTFLIKVPSCLADVVTCLLVFRLVSDRCGPRVGLWSALGVALSPTLIVISGFHGNTDPVFVMFSILSFALAARGRAALSGVSLAVAISIKLVPVVVLPVVLWTVARAGRGAVLRFLGAGGLVAAIVWGPALALRGADVWTQVVFYRGIGFSEWGLPQFARWAGAPGIADAFIEHGGLATVLIASSAALLLVMSRSLDPAQGFGFALVLLLVLSPAFGMQYLTWPLAASYLLLPRLAAVYNAVSGVFVLLVYSRWCQAWPGDWYEAKATPFSVLDLLLMSLAWISLVAVAVECLVQRRKAWRAQ